MQIDLTFTIYHLVSTIILVLPVVPLILEYVPLPPSSFAVFPQPTNEDRFFIRHIKKTHEERCQNNSPAVSSIPCILVGHFFARHSVYRKENHYRNTKLCDTRMHVIVCWAGLSQINRYLGQELW